MREKVLFTVAIWHYFHKAFVAELKEIHSQHIICLSGHYFYTSKSSIFSVLTAFQFWTSFPPRPLNHQNSLFTLMPLTLCLRGAASPPSPLPALDTRCPAFWPLQGIPWVLCVCVAPSTFIHVVVGTPVCMPSRAPGSPFSASSPKRALSGLVDDSHAAGVRFWLAFPWRWWRWTSFHVGHVFLGRMSVQILWISLIRFVSDVVVTSKDFEAVNPCVQDCRIKRIGIVQMPSQDALRTMPSPQKRKHPSSCLNQPKP